MRSRTARYWATPASISSRACDSRHDAWHRLAPVLRRLRHLRHRARGPRDHRRGRLGTDDRRRRQRAGRPPSTGRRLHLTEPNPDRPLLDVDVDPQAGRLGGRHPVARPRAATSSTPGRACSPSPTTGSPCRTRPPTPAGGSSSSATSMPRDVAGKPIDPTEWNRNDGFSPSSPILTYVPGLDLARHLGHAPAPSSPTWPARWPPTRRSSCSTPTPASGTRSGPSSTSTPAPPTTPASSSSDPAVQLTEGHRYIVALRDLRGDRRVDHRPGPGLPRLPGRRQRPGRGVAHASSSAGPTSSSCSASCRSAGVGRHDLFLTWDFTVASTPQPHRAGAAHPRRRLRPPRRHRPRRPHGRRPAPRLRDHQGRGPPGRGHDAARRGHHHRPELPHPAGRGAPRAEPATSARPSATSSTRCPTR